MQSQFAVILTIAGLFSVPIIGAQSQENQTQAAVAKPVEGLGTLAEMSPGQLIVSYQNGELAIRARNVPLLEILRRVCSEVGADIDAPTGASEPTFVDLGPGPARQVLFALLAGSRFNYVMQALEEHPNVLARLTVVPIRDRPDKQNPAILADASEAPPTPGVDESISPKVSPLQVKDLLAEAKGELANLGSDDVDPSVKDSAAQLLSMLENSVETLAANASSSDQQIPSAQPGSNPPPGRQLLHRQR
jgi:hypothetical protein